MSVKLSLEHLKEQYIGKQFNWLTIVDVYRNEELSKWFVVCKCKCGNTVSQQINKVTSGRLKSCGCFVKSDEFANKRRAWCANNYDKIRQYTGDVLKQKTESLNNEYVGKTYNWLTVLEVFPVFYDNGRLKRYDAKCKCKCGKDTITRLGYVTSGHTKSCGCYNHSKEHNASLSKFWKDHPDKVADRAMKHSEWNKNNKDKVADQGKRHSQWYKDNPDKAKERSEKYKQWCRDNQDKLIEQGNAHSQYYKDNPDVLKTNGEKISQWYKDRRSSNDLTKLVEVVHSSCIDSLLNGDIRCVDNIKTKCPVCGKYDEHLLSSVWSYTKNEFSRDTLPMCNSCRHELVISKYEKEVADIISAFYSGECIRNDRSVLNGKELDLYYPEKKIAIEYNGDYWHSEEFKDGGYHYNKYKQCRDLGITLVSIFEYDWSSRKEAIIDYLKDLFSNKINSLSVNESYNYMNNNYPSPLLQVDNSVELHYYVLNNNTRVYTCGFSKLIRS